MNDRMNARLQQFAMTVELGETIHIQGFASIDGDPAFNENLSCARAIKAQSIVSDVLRARGVSANVHLFNHGATLGTDPADQRSVVISRSGVAPPSPGPQSFAGMQPGTQHVNPFLRERNQDIEAELFAVAENYLQQDDFRWFFGYAHAHITQQINQNLSLFQRPNELLRLNTHFAEEWLRAAKGQPHEAWREAFRRCQALKEASSETISLVGELEFCGAAMANVHINVDLAAALSEVGCIPPADFGNMLVLVNQGNVAAIVRYRDPPIGAAEAIVMRFLAPALDLDVEAWRNTAYQRICKTAVAPVQPGFSPVLAPR
jgi:hypothetical protein